MEEIIYKCERKLNSYNEYNKEDFDMLIKGGVFEAFLYINKQIKLKVITKCDSLPKYNLHIDDGDTYGKMEMNNSNN